MWTIIGLLVVGIVSLTVMAVKSKFYVSLGFHANRKKYHVTLRVYWQKRRFGYTYEKKGDWKGTDGEQASDQARFAGIPLGGGGDESKQSFAYIRRLLQFSRQLDVERCDSTVVFGHPDAAIVGMGTGMLWAAIGTLWGVLTPFIRLRAVPNIQVIPVYHT
ncbi:MAG: DUF2953 domain-containing protein, partial [Bacilli bacterium]